MYNDRQYVIFNVSELNKINFNEVLETSSDTVRKSTDGTRTFVKWEDGNNVPPSVTSLTTKSGYLTHDEILAILNGPDWTAPMKDEM